MLELLTALERPTRRPLCEVVRELHQNLDEAAKYMSEPLAYGEAIARCFNRAALVECVFGRPTAAVALCNAQLRWMEGLARRTGQRALLLGALQAWVNLARVDRMLCRHDIARSRLDLLLAGLRAQPIDLQEACIDESDWIAMERRMPELRRFLQTVWLTETLLGLLRRGQHELVERVSRQAASDRLPQALLTVLIEAEIIAARWRSQSLWKGRALRLSEPMPAFQEDVLTLRVIELRLNQDEKSTLGWASATALQISERCLSGLNNDVHLALLQHLVALLERLDQTIALPVAAAAHDRAIALNDEVSMVWFADICAKYSKDEALWRDRSEEVRERSWYSTIRKEDHPKTAWSESVGNLSDRLLTLE